MKRPTFFGAFAALLSAGSVHAVDADALAVTCPIGGMTYMCSYAYTKLTIVEAALYHNGEVEVRGVFNGPGYQAELEASSDVLWFWPSSWTAEVKMQPVCAWSGVSSAAGVHRVAPAGIPPITVEETLTFHVQFACDCNTEIE